jgi:ABC-2 type transport system ATP-binding protein
MSTLVAEFAEVSKTYGATWRSARPVRAVRGVSFGIEAGEVLALVGPNRAGKTTLLKILLGLCQPSAGRVWRLGQSLRNRSTLARVGYMHENQAFPPYLSAVTLLEAYGELSGVLRSDVRARMRRLLDLVGLADRAREPIARFSKGMKQRLALAQAVLSEPDLLVLDEPTEGLDLNARLVLQEIIHQQRGAGKSVLVVSHALEELAQVCDRLAVLVEGRLVHLGSLAALLRDPATGCERSLTEALEPIYRC